MQTERDQLLRTVRNLARFHREHEKFYSESPFHDVIRLQRNSRALKALAERHRIVSNDWQCASMAELIARNLDRAVAILGRAAFTPAALRADLTAHRVVPRYLFSASEMLDFAADLAAHSAVLTHENERRWRIFHERVDQIVGAADTPGGKELPPEGR